MRDVDREPSADVSLDAKASGDELRGSVLDVVRALLAGNDRDAVLEIVGKLVAENAELSQRLARSGFRFKSSERLNRAQLVMFLDALERDEDDDEDEGPDEVDEADTKLRKASGIDEGKDDLAKRKTRPPRQPHSRAPAPAHLHRVDNPLLVPDALRACPRCGSDRVCIGHDVSEVIELIPAEVVVRLDRREKLRCDACEGQLARAPAGDKVVESGKLGLALVAQLLVEKYVDGLPLHRQRERYQRLGLELAVSTLADQVKWCTDLLRPLWRAALSQVLGARVLHLDGTGLSVLDPKAKGGKRLGALWGYVGVNASEIVAAYLYASTAKATGQRAGELGPQDMLALREGLTVADASGLFDASFERKGLIECGCNMHSRRYFVKALDSGDQRAALAIAAYRKLYEIEDEIRELDPDEKLKQRLERSKPLWDELVAWCHVRKKHEPPSSTLGVALRYFTNHQTALGRFLEYGVVPLDNGIVERLHVRAALTRKNFLFVGADSGGERAAIAYTILGSCRLAGVEPIEYLRDVLPRLTGKIRILDLPALLPSRWKQRRDAVAAFCAALARLGSGS
jgi:transposase